MSTACHVCCAGPEAAGELVRLRTVILDSPSRGAGRGWQPHAVELPRERLSDPDGDFAVFVVDRPPGAHPGGAGRPEPGAARPLAACATGTVERRPPGPGNPLGLSGHVFNVATDPDLRRRSYSRARMTALPDCPLHLKGVGGAPTAGAAYARSTCPRRRRASRCTRRWGSRGTRRPRCGWSPGCSCGWSAEGPSRNPHRPPGAAWYTRPARPPAALRWSLRSGACRACG